MKHKKFLLLAFCSIFSLILVSCSPKVNTDEVRQYSDTITEDILLSMANLNYDEFKGYLDPVMEELVPDETAFINLVMPIQEACGTYTKGSLEFVHAKESGDFINLIYKGKFTNEEKPVNISISFKKDDTKHKVSNLYFSSPKIDELSKDK